MLIDQIIPYESKRPILYTLTPLPKTCSLKALNPMKHAAQPQHPKAPPAIKPPGPTPRPIAACMQPSKQPRIKHISPLAKPNPTYSLNSSGGRAGGQC